MKIRIHETGHIPNRCNTGQDDTGCVVHNYLVSDFVELLKYSKAVQAFAISDNSHRHGACQHHRLSASNCVNTRVLPICHLSQEKAI